MRTTTGCGPLPVGTRSSPYWLESSPYATRRSGARLGTDVRSCGVMRRPELPISAGAGVVFCAQPVDSASEASTVTDQHLRIGVTMEASEKSLRGRLP